MFFISIIQLRTIRCSFFSNYLQREGHIRSRITQQNPELQHPIRHPHSPAHSCDKLFLYIEPPKNAYPPNKDEEESTGSGGIVIALIVVEAILAAGAAAFVLLRKRK